MVKSVGMEEGEVLGLAAVVVVHNIPPVSLARRLLRGVSHSLRSSFPLSRRLVGAYLPQTLVRRGCEKVRRRTWWKVERLGKLELVRRERERWSVI